MIRALGFVALNVVKNSNCSQVKQEQFTRHCHISKSISPLYNPFALKYKQKVLQNIHSL